MKTVVFVLLGYLLVGTVNAQNKPAWVDAPSSVYPESLYISAVGNGGNRQAAEGNAKAALVSYFKQSVSAKAVSLRQSVSSRGEVTTSSGISQLVETSAALDSLIGVEIKAVWEDTQRKTGWYAVAVMEKGKGRERYAGEIDKAVRDITRLIDIADGVSFATLSQCNRARELLGGAELNALVLSMLGGSDRLSELNGLSVKIDAVLKQAKDIPVDVRVSGDINGRFKAAFSQTFTDMGFRTGDRKARFALEVTVQFEALDRNRYYNTGYTIDAVLKDTVKAAALCTYNVSDRESHPAGQRDADSRATLVAEQKIREGFPETLRGYLGINP